MGELEDLYREVILDHNRSPRNFRALPDADRSREGYNPLCGDRITVYLRMAGDVIEEVTFEGSGCAISKASASVMTTALRGKTRGEARELFEKFQALVTGRAAEDPATMGEMAALGGVSQFPTRVKCATLGWHTALAALTGQTEPVSTEEEN
jgi:nitrogen fixation NifU-like protein